MSIDRHILQTPRGELPYLLAKSTASGHTPLVVFLHGAKDRGSDPTKLTTWGLPKYVSEATTLPYHFLALQIPEDTTWPDWRQELLGLIDNVVAHNAIDPQRVILSGFSLGTAGTWQIASQHPERFAGVVAVSGRVPEPVANGGLNALRDTPLWVFHGEKDDRAPLSSAEDAVNALRALNAPVNFSVIPGADHFIADAVYPDPDLQSWLANIPALPAVRQAA
ncbi:alpha/beta fold hydrolase [Uliginosibacterium sp. H1]|uniref:carboxylesterase family protein n=1 Tax=Uliginosibacterium sp. H1 TaxID=3114757 RepID=UPI002E19FFE7|nr:alpha/beta fold hydrolase [Uliginosibacterium sp. H1]